MPSFARKYTIGKGKIGQIPFFYTNIIIGGVGCGMWDGTRIGWITETNTTIYKIKNRKFTT